MQLPLDLLQLHVGQDCLIALSDQVLCSAVPHLLDTRVSLLIGLDALIVIKLSARRVLVLHVLVASELEGGFLVVFKLDNLCSYYQTFMGLLSLKGRLGANCVSVVNVCMEVLVKIIVQSLFHVLSVLGSIRWSF